MSSSWVRRQPTLLPGRAVPAHRLYVMLAAGRGFCLGIALALYSLYVVRDAALSPFQLVIVGAALEGATFLFEVPTGVIADTVSRRLSVVAGTILFGAGPLLWGFFPSFEGIIAGQVAFGVGYTFISGAQEAWLADEVGEAQAARLYPRAAQFRQAANIIGILAGAGLGLLDHALPMLVGGGALVLLALPLAMTMTERGYIPAPPAPEVSIWSGLVATLRGGLAAVRASGPIRAAFLVTLFVGASSESFDRLWGYHLLHTVGVPAAVDEVLLFAGIGLLGQLGGMLLVQLAIRMTADAARERLAALLAVLYAVIVVAVVRFALAGSFWLAFAALLVALWARIAEVPFFTAWLNRGLDPRMRATVLSTVSQGNALGQLGAGPLFAVIAAAVGVPLALLLGGVLTAPAIVLVRAARYPAASTRVSRS